MVTLFVRTLDSGYTSGVITTCKKSIREWPNPFQSESSVFCIMPKKNEETNPDYRCKHVCIEPFEMPWLEKVGVLVIRKKVEDIEVPFFSELEENDILFIDSSHVIRPEGDVLYEYLELLPTLNKGVIVHIHDIFSPKNYMAEWLIKEVRFWNEQYLLEALLTHNKAWKIIGSLNYLHHNYYDKVKSVCP